MTKDIDKDKLEQLVSQLEINVENVYHLILPNGTEMVGELFPAEQMWQEFQDENEDRESFADLLAEEGELVIEFTDKDGNEYEVEGASPDDLLFLNPIKIHRENWIDPAGIYIYTNHFVEWNPCLDGPYTHINKDNIVSMNRPNAETMLNYLKAVYELYYPLINEISEDKLHELQSRINDKFKKNPGLVGPNNVIDFKWYRSKRLNGKF